MLWATKNVIPNTKWLTQSILSYKLSQDSSELVQKLKDDIKAQAPSIFPLCHSEDTNIFLYGQQVAASCHTLQPPNMRKDKFSFTAFREETSRLTHWASLPTSKPIISESNGIKLIGLE